MKFPTASDVGPGDYTADHPFQASRPSCIFAHPLRTLKKDEIPEPGRYDLPPTVGATTKYGGVHSQPGYSMLGRSEAGSAFRKSEVPGPGSYDSDLTAIDPDSYCAAFTRSNRAHPSEDVDPMEPPGPGLYKVSKDAKPTDKPVAAFSRSDRFNHKVKARRAAEVPGPGLVLKSTLQEGGCSLASLLPRRVEVKLGPGQYEPADSLTRQASPNWRSLHRTAPRRAPWETAHFSDDQAGGHADMIKRAIKAVEDAGYSVNTNTETGTKITGPSITMGARRAPRGAGAYEPPDSENHHAMVGSFGSLTPRTSSRGIARKAAATK